MLKVIKESKREARNIGKITHPKGAPEKQAVVCQSAPPVGKN
jgi:hypothetical protein